MKIKVRRQEDSNSAVGWQIFNYEKSGRQTVAKILDTLNYRDDLVDENGVSQRRIRWECSCLQKSCGACAIVINGKPGLACATFIDTDNTDLLVLSPLTKFPVVSDLIVDRSIIADHQIAAQAYLGSLGNPDEKEFEDRYQAAKCLKCGLCLEVCPNYKKDGKKFYGAVFANESYLLHSSTKDRKKEIKKEYNKHFAVSCSKSLACKDICPAGMPTLSSIGYMNRAK